MVLEFRVLAELEQPVVVFALGIQLFLVDLVIAGPLVGVFAVEFKLIFTVCIVGVLVFFLVFDVIVGRGRAVIWILSFQFQSLDLVVVAFQLFVGLDFQRIVVFTKQQLVGKLFVGVFRRILLLLVHGGIRHLIVLAAAGGPQSWRLGPSAFTGRLAA